MGSLGTLFYHINLIGKVIPPGYQALDFNQRRYCAILKGDCGAEVPIYRHLRVADGRICRLIIAVISDNEA